MAVFDDETVLNDAGTAGDWTVSDFDSPTLNNSSSTTPIYREGGTCMWWPLKKGVTTGYAYDAGGNEDMTGRIVMAWWNQAAPDIDNIPITLLRLRISSDTGFTTNYREWDALAQIQDEDLYGWTPIRIYNANQDGAGGTLVENSISSWGWVATTGNTADGKQGGFDQMIMIGFIGGHSENWGAGFFTDLYNDTLGAKAKDLGVYFEFGDFYKTNVNIQMGHGTSDTADTIIFETNKIIFFDNVEPEHNLGYVFVDPNSTHEIEFSMVGCVHFWNEQDGTSPEIFTDAGNATIWRMDGCSFLRGGAFTCGAHTGSAFVTNTSITQCGLVDPGVIPFERNIITDTSETAADSGAMLLSSTVHNMEECTFVKGTAASHAIVFDTAGDFLINDCAFTGYNASDGQADSTFRNESGGHVKIIINTVVGGGNVSVQNGAGSTTEVANSPRLFQVEVIDQDGVEVANARVFVETGESVTDGQMYQAAVTSITRSAAVATVTLPAAHGLETGENIVVRGAQPDGYNKVAVVTRVSDTVLTYAVDSGLSTPATGTPVVSYVMFNDTTNSFGIRNTFKALVNAQLFTGWTRKSSATPFLRPGPIVFTANENDGNVIGVTMIADEG